MTATTAPIGQKDAAYFWHNVCFSVDGYLFQVSRQQFIQGSEYFAEKYGLCEPIDGPEAATVVELEGITASEFRTFLKLVFPSLTTSTNLTLTKEEWLTILTLSTLWRFHEFRNLAIQHIDPHLTDPIELVQLGRAAFVLKWVLAGYETLVQRPEAISEEECDIIGDRTANRLYLARHALSSGFEVRSSIERLLRSRFTVEVSLLESEATERRTKVERERDLKEAEDAKEAKRIVEEFEAKEEAERLRKEEEARAKEEAMLRERAEKEARELEACRLQEIEARKSEEEKRLSYLRDEENRLIHELEACREKRLETETRQQETKDEEEKVRKEKEENWQQRRESAKERRQKKKAMLLAKKEAEDRAALAMSEMKSSGWDDANTAELQAPQTTKQPEPDCVPEPDYNPEPPCTPEQDYKPEPDYQKSEPAYGPELDYQPDF